MASKEDCKNQILENNKAINIEAPCSAVRKRRSIRRSVFDDTSIPTETILSEDYSNKIEKEINDWKSIFRTTHNAKKETLAKLEKLKGTKIDPDLSKLDQNQRDFLNNLPDLQKFQEEIDEFLTVISIKNEIDRIDNFKITNI